MILGFGIAVLVMFVITNVLAGVLSAISYKKTLSRKEKVLTTIPKRLPGFLIGKGIALLRDKH